MNTRFALHGAHNRPTQPPPRWGENEDAPTTPIPESQRMLYAYRSVVFNGELRDDNGMEIISRLVLLSAEDPHSDIHLWINSPGGSVPMMHAIADTIETLPNDVVTVAFGWAASAGQFVLMMGTPGRRLALPHARILLHQGSSGIGGAAADIELQSGDLRNVRDSVLHRIAEATGKTYERIFDDSLRDRWFTAKQALDYGLIDRVVDSPADLRGGIGAP
ncbi:MAG: ATP-dependent Clp protease proteolytic subunit [Brevibacterium sp.]|uniref:ClpP family protease n=1 Tax=Brevibacterium sandarakinum TaxID=629680 RepID=UPI0026567158|nr:ATP-dependent Clp protease proteolytic subunit [Brevibacterium sandarakinum]MDN5587787.1 ATP-dependent Clp protease proteolytic subunit [Brevibacterium sp.]MDN5657565.1 ATP-dependent Clp protease proteolytic subunit [Brevibacterium sandarakinum]